MGPRDTPREPYNQRRKLYGRTLTEARLAHGLTQEQAAERVGISLASWKRYESGRSDPRPGGIVDKALLDFVVTAPTRETPPNE